MVRGEKPSGGATSWVPLLVIVTVIWGNSFIAIKHIVAHVTPLQLVAVRFIPVAITFAAWLLPTRGRRIWQLVRADGWRLALLGLIGGVAYNAFLAWGETRVAAGTASLIIALNPAFTYLLSVLFLEERFAWQRALGIAVAFIGLFIIIRWGSGQELTLDEVKYALITLCAPVCWAVYTVGGKRIVSRHPPLLVTAIAMSFAGLFSLTFVDAALLRQLPALPASFWWAVAFLALLCTVFAFSVWFGALKAMPAGRVASFVYLVPMFANGFSSLLLEEPITLGLIVGAAILILGVWLVNRR